jgi:sigma-B regulation protein RsbU (phosphoserine phosphatase)
MTSPTSSTFPAADWQALFSLSRKEADDQQVLEAQLAAWCEAHGVDAALYCPEEGGASIRRVDAGATAFPDALPDALPEGWRRLELPAAVLLHTARSATVTAAAVDPQDPRLLLLAAGVRISCLKREIHQQSFQAKFRGVELEALYEMGLAIASTLDLDALGEEVLLRAMSLLDARRGALYLLDGDVYRLDHAIGGEAWQALAADAADVAAIRSGEGNGSADWLPGARHLLAVSVEIDGDPRGFLVVADKESRRGVGPFPATDRRTLALFANQAAIALENAKLHKLALEKERLEREMELAAEIQQQILPKVMPVVPGFEVAGWNRPARQVGGDYFDVHDDHKGHLGLIVGDVTGKGMPAALLVSTLHSALHVLLDRMEISIELIERLNRHICESSSVNKFITMLLATLDCASNRLVYLNAGHNPGLVLRGDGAPIHLTSGGLPLGLMPQGKYGSAYLDLEPGDLVCIYSDGITECEGPDEEEFGLERLVDVLRENRDRPLGEVIAAIDRAATGFAEGRPQGDDQTVVLLRRQ